AKQDLTGLVITLTNRRTELTGTLTTGDAVPASSYLVIAFPDDRRYWAAGGRRIRAAQPDSAGHFSIEGLPAGAYRLAVADVDADEVDDRLLARLVSDSIGVTLADGERKTQDLKI